MNRGSCSCGAVRYELAGPVQLMNHCHCSRCRKHSGSAFGSFLHAEGAGFRWVAGIDARRSYTPEGGTERAHCATCGSPVPILENGGADVIVPAGSLDTDPGIRPVFHAFAAAAAPWHEITDDVPRFAAFPPDDFIDEILEST